MPGRRREAGGSVDLAKIWKIVIRKSNLIFGKIYLSADRAKHFFALKRFFFTEKQNRLGILLKKGLA